MANKIIIGSLFFILISCNADPKNDKFFENKEYLLYDFSFSVQVYDQRLSGLFKEINYKGSDSISGYKITHTIYYNGELKKLKTPKVFNFNVSEKKLQLIYKRIVEELTPKYQPSKSKLKDLMPRWDNEWRSGIVKLNLKNNVISYQMKTQLYAKLYDYIMKQAS